MAELERKDMKIYGENAAEKDIVAYGSDLKGNTIIQTRDPDQIQNAAYSQGIRAAVIGPNATTLPSRQALDYLFSRQLAYLFQKGVAEWSATTEYFIGATVSDANGGLYTSIKDNNTGHEVSDTSYWLPFPTAAQLAEKVAKAGDTMTGALKFDKSLATPIMFKYDDESDEGIRIGRSVSAHNGKPLEECLIEVDGLIDQFLTISGRTGQIMVKRSPGETSNAKELATTEWVRTLLSFKSTGSVTIAEGNLSIAGDYVLTNLPENTIPKLAFINCYIGLPVQGGSTTIAVSSSICEAIYVCQTNNGFGASGFVLLPVGTDRKISISFPVTAGGLSLATVTLLGYI